MLIAGDFNTTLDECPFLRNLSRDGWKDFGHLPTCLASQTRGQGRRIDLSVANGAFGAMVMQYTTHWELGLPTHAVQQWSTDRAKQPRVFNYSLGKGLGEDPKFDGDLWNQEWLSREALFWAAVEAQDVDRAWKQLEPCLVRAHGSQAKPP